MKFNESWLRSLVDPGVDFDTLLAQLTMAGLEVEGVEAAGVAFDGVVVARIAAVAPHPNADKLSVCQVDDGSGRHQVVCGAPNARTGLVTAFARPGARLPGDVRIRRTKLRDVESHGMLCSAAELGLGDDASGIIELDGLKPGVDLREALALDDRTADLKITPNRGDCLSLRGLAREVGVLTGANVAPVSAKAVATTSDRVVHVRLDDPHGCPRYLGRVIEGIDRGAATPVWMVERLRRCGLRSIDAVVDVTNYVLLELGQPMHAFDLDRLDGDIVVRRARAGERLTLLDGADVELASDTLLITDDGGPVAIAGVMGGERSGVHDDTRNVFLECAFFAPAAVAGIARRYGLQTDASYRYERGVDFELQPAAIERATELLVAITGGRPGPVVEARDDGALPKRARVALRQRRLEELLGVAMDAAEVDALFARLGFDVLSRVESEKGIIWTVQAPSHRFDIAIEADLVEEVCRIHGYNRIPARMPTATLPLKRIPLERSHELVLKRLLVDGGWQEVITYSFVDPVLQDLLDPGVAPLALENPMSAELSVMRTSMLPGLVATLAGNVARQQDRVRVFETGLVFRRAAVLRQTAMIGGVLWGLRDAESWHAATERADFFDAKGAVDQILAWSGLAASFERLEDPVLHPGQAAAVLSGGRRIGRVGRLHPEVEHRLDLRDVFCFELELEAVLERPRRRQGEVSRFPSVRRDLALVVANEVGAAALEATVREVLGSTLVDFRFFDVYRGKGIDSTEKSIALGLTLQHPSDTLTDADITGHVQAALAALAARWGARLR